MDINNSLFKIVFIIITTTLILTSNCVVYADASFYLIQERLKPDSSSFIKIIDKPLFLDPGEAISDHQIEKTYNYIVRILDGSNLNLDDVTIYISRKEIKGKAEASTIYNMTHKKTAIVIATKYATFQQMMQIFYHEYAHYIHRKYQKELGYYDINSTKKWHDNPKEIFAENMKCLFIKKYFPDYCSTYTKTSGSYNHRRFSWYINQTIKDLEGWQWK